MQTTLTGTPDEVLQQLADEVGKLSVRVTDNEDKAIAAEAVAHLLLRVLAKWENFDQAKWNATLVNMAHRYSSPSIPLDEESAERLKNVGLAVLQFRVDADGQTPRPSHPLFRVIDGGKDS
jgi:hypothetical protein